MDIITPYMINNRIKNRTIDIDLNDLEKQELFKIICTKLNKINLKISNFSNKDTLSDENEIKIQDYRKEIIKIRDQIEESMITNKIISFSYISVCILYNCIETYISEIQKEQSKWGKYYTAGVSKATLNIKNIFENEFNLIKNKLFSNYIKMTEQLQELYDYINCSGVFEDEDIDGDLIEICIYEYEQEYLLNNLHKIKEIIENCNDDISNRKKTFYVLAFAVGQHEYIKIPKNMMIQLIDNLIKMMETPILYDKTFYLSTIDFFLFNQLMTTMYLRYKKQKEQSTNILDISDEENILYKNCIKTRMFIPYNKEIFEIKDKTFKYTNIPINFL